MGGSFTEVGPYTRNRFAAFRISNGELLPNRPSFNGAVEALAVNDTGVYAGGSFSSVNGVARPRLAAVRPSNGALTGWAPKADNTVYALTRNRRQEQDHRRRPLPAGQRSQRQRPRCAGRQHPPTRPF